MVSSVRSGIEFFEKKNQLRVVMTGHGFRIQGEPKIAVPPGITIHFYVDDGVSLDDKIGQAVEGFTGKGMVRPKETRKSGDLIWNYYLSYSVGLKVNATKLRAKYDLITISEANSDRAIPLSILFKDSRCKNAEVHWACCREIKVNDEFVMHDKLHRFTDPRIEGEKLHDWDPAKFNR